MLHRLRRFPRTAFALIFTGFFIAFLVILAAVGMISIQRDLDQRLDEELRGFNSIARDIRQTTAALKSRPDITPCTDDFMSWMRRVAYLPDGIHEIIYAPQGKMLCSISQGIFAEPVTLNQHDFHLGSAGIAQIWLNRDLAQLGFPGIVGTYMSIHGFILVVPDVQLISPVPDWMSFELVNLAEDGTVWHRSGTHGLYSHITGQPEARSVLNPWHPPGWSTSGCDETYSTCLALHLPFLAQIKRAIPTIIGGIVLAGLLASVITHLMRKSVEKAWSLPARVARNMTSETITCHYQPLQQLADGGIWGVEVLARWRDDDGTLVPPDAFLPIVEQRGLHRKLTRLVVDRAYADLSTLPARDEPMRVHVNIFPCEFEPEWMLELFKDFLADSERFTVVIELVESDILPIERTRNAIARLRGYGILTFIDDFGEGYSSIGYLAGLGTYGVKLDRSFAQAPEGSLMDAMLSSAVEMVGKTGQTLVVEGVETASRLAILKQNSKVAIAQGYFISRPLGIEDLRSLLGPDGYWSEAHAA